MYRVQKPAPSFSQNITAKMIADEEDSFAECEWKFAAMVVDRFCLIVFSIFIIGSTFGIFASAPYLVE